jgi:hypothetical protein
LLLQLPVQRLLYRLLLPPPLLLLLPRLLLRVPRNLQSP